MRADKQTMVVRRAGKLPESLRLKLHSSKERGKCGSVTDQQGRGVFIIGTMDPEEFRRLRER